MHHELTEEQSLIQQMARDFAVREVEPLARSLDREGTWPTGLVKRMAELGQKTPEGGYRKFKVMGREFDPAKPGEYAASFAIKRL